MLACVSVQGCIVDLWNSLLEESIAEKNKVPETKARFHINGVELYREDDTPLTRRHHFYIRKKEGSYLIIAQLRSVGEDNTKGDKWPVLWLYIPENLFYEGISLRNEGTIVYYPNGSCTRVAWFSADGRDSRSVAHLLRGDYLEISIPKFDGFEVGDSIRINFAFKLSEIDWKIVNEVETDCGIIDTYICKDGVLKEVIRDYREY